MQKEHRGNYRSNNKNNPTQNKRKSAAPMSSAVKLLPSPTPDPLSTIQGLHPLRGTTDSCIILDMQKMLQDDILFVWHSSNGCYGTDTVPLSPQYFVAAYTFLHLDYSKLGRLLALLCPSLFLLLSHLATPYLLCQRSSSLHCRRCTGSGNFERSPSCATCR